MPGRLGSPSTRDLLAATSVATGLPCPLLSLPGSCASFSSPPIANSGPERSLPQVTDLAAAHTRPSPCVTPFRASGRPTSTARRRNAARTPAHRSGFGHASSVARCDRHYMRSMQEDGLPSPYIAIPGPVIGGAMPFGVTAVSTPSRFGDRTSRGYGDFFRMWPFPPPGQHGSPQRPLSRRTPTLGALCSRRVNTKLASATSDPTVLAGPPLAAAGPAHRSAR